MSGKKSWIIARVLQESAEVDDIWWGWGGAS